MDKLMDPAEWSEWAEAGTRVTIGGGVLLVMDTPRLLSISGMPQGGFGPRPTVTIDPRYLDDLITALEGCRDRRQPSPSRDPH